MTENNSATISLIESYRKKAIVTESSSQATCELSQLFLNKIGISVQELAFNLGISNRTVERAIKNGDLKVKRIGRRVIILRQSIEAWLNRKD